MSKISNKTSIIITDKIIKEATELYITTDITYSKLAKKYGVKTATIHYALNKDVSIKKVFVDKNQPKSKKRVEILTDIQKIEIKKAYDNKSKVKTTYEKLAKEYGVGMSTIRKICKPEQYPNLTKLGLNKNSKFSEEVKIEIIESLKAGFTRKEVSEVYGMSPTGITALMKRKGLQHLIVDSRIKLTDAQKDEIFAQKDKVSIEQLSINYNTSISSINKIFRKHNSGTLVFEVDKKLFNRSEYYTPERTKKYSRASYEHMVKIKQKLKEENNI